MNESKGMPANIIVRGATVHNLQNIDLEIPHNKLTVITGVSGSGKSSLAFDTLCKEGQRRYLESFSTRARQLLGKLGTAQVESIEHLSPAIAIDQRTANGNPRSTVGTMSELYDHLRLLFARLGEQPSNSEKKLTRSLFSFNADGACQTCNGLGVTDQIDSDLLISDPARTLREGALAITTDSGYIIYSQVTMDVLNQICQAHDFHVDIPWLQLTEQQKHIILYGSRRLKIPFGKHTLESRMKWTGIKARPRQEGYYGGIIPVMEQILKRDRNKNILRFARTGTCPQCQGSRLCKEAREVTFSQRNISEFSAMNIARLAEEFAPHALTVKKADTATFEAIQTAILHRCELLLDLGLGYLTLDRRSPTLSGGEAQRIRLAGVVGSGLQGMTYVMDEPSIGLHPRDNARLLRLLKQLVNQGNTVIVVEHDEATMMAADWLVDIGPAAGKNGGRVLFSGSPKEAFSKDHDPLWQNSPTYKCLLNKETKFSASRLRSKTDFIEISNASRHNLNGFDLKIPLGAMTVVTGVSGAGKSSLLLEIQEQLSTKFSSQNLVDQIVIIDQSPIGRTPRSNAATYTKLFDPVRSLFAAQPSARQAGFAKGKFSFNNKGGRCETCQGAGVQTIGMHFLGDVENQCPRCLGRRFLPEILAVTYKGKNIHQVLEMCVDEAVLFFVDEIKIHRQLVILQDLGLGYLPLGQPSTTLSGGEAQRIKLASELGKARKAKPFYILDEPTTGLHSADIEILLRAFKLLTDNGATIVVSEHHDLVIRAAHCLVDLGPESGNEGGQLLFCGAPEKLISVKRSITAAYLFNKTGPGLIGSDLDQTASAQSPEIELANSQSANTQSAISLRGVQTHNLKNIDIDIPKGKITVITGVSGSGKSSLAMATLCAEGRYRYAENFSTYMRQMLTGRARPQLTSCQGLSPTIAIGQKAAAGNRRSVVATVVEIHPLFRLLMSRFGQGPLNDQANPPASHFSFNDHRSACLQCRGLGSITVPDKYKLITHPDRSLLCGAMNGHKTSRFYGEPEGQYTATLKAVGILYGIDFSIPWSELSEQARSIAMDGTGDQTYQVKWEFQRGGNTGTHDFNGPWPGFSGHILNEYTRKHDDKRGQAMLTLMKQDVCPGCHGQRLSASALGFRFEGLNMAEICALSVQDAQTIFARSEAPSQLRKEILLRLQTLNELGLSYLNLDRSIKTLSSGESQRVHLARQLGARLCGVTYVLDEPTLGLHPQDIEPLWHTICRLRDDGNTVVLVEHDLEIIRRADWIVDLGPGPGVHGGEIIASGTVSTIMNCSNSPTAAALKKKRKSPKKLIGKFSRKAIFDGADLILKNANQNNLQDLEVGFATGCITAVTGVSGSGKSSLVFGILGATFTAGHPVGCSELSGMEKFGEVISVGRSSQAATTGSNPATVLGIMDSIRKLLVDTDEARAQNFRKKHFATAQPGGRCETCKGRGHLSVSLDFLADVKRNCDHCHGTGFLSEVLSCRIFNSNLPEILNLTVTEAAQVFESKKTIGPKLLQLVDVGLGYLKLGQETGTLSGGERQRLYLAKELLSGSRSNKLYLFDEPSAGLHEADIDLLINLFRKLISAGNTVIFTEHHQGLISIAHKVFELKDGLIRK